MSKNVQLVFSHGKESGPYGVKITAMMAVADELGIHSDSLDYQGMDEPQARVEKLIAYTRELSEPVILVGSSMGAYVSIKASQSVNTKGLFLLAPAVFMPGYKSQDMAVPETNVMVIHGRQDEIVPVANALRFAQQQRCDLLLLEDDHVLRNSLARVCAEFKAFLVRLDSA